MKYLREELKANSAFKGWHKNNFAPFLFKFDSNFVSKKFLECLEKILR